jgi:hypothetical protein
MCVCAYVYACGWVCHVCQLRLGILVTLLPPSLLGAALLIKVADIPAAAVAEFLRLGVAFALAALALSYTAAAFVLSDSALLPSGAGPPARAIPPAVSRRRRRRRRRPAPHIIGRQPGRRSSRWIPER